MEVLKSMALWFVYLKGVIGKQLYSQTMSTLAEVLKSSAPFFTAAILVLQSPIVKDYFFPRLTMIIEGSDDLGQNQIYEAATTYVRNMVSVSPNPRHFKCGKAIKGEELVFDFVGEDTIIDNFQGIKLEWKSRAKINEHDGKTVSKYFELSFDKRYEIIVQESYISLLLAHAEKIRKEELVVRLYSRGGSGLGEWQSINFEHPATFEKLAMDIEMRRRLKDDLDRFVERKDWYKKVGRAWKRGYLIYGPPGTGKSTLIAAMANYLKFDIYNLDISSINSDSDLREILLSTSNGSIVVFEDIDCAGLEKGGQQNKASSAKFTLSGLLNVIDGLWSSCGEERIIVFTTTHKDKLDPALLRPGLMDLHVHMSYCTMDGFKLLASNYLDINGDHELYRQIEGLLENVEVTPAEIAEQLLKSGGTDVLGGLVKFLEQKILQKAEAAELKELLKSDDDTDVDVEGFVKFLMKKKLKNAKAEEAVQLLKSDHTDDDVDADVEKLVKLFKKKKLEDAKAAETK